MSPSAKRSNTSSITLINPPAVLRTTVASSWSWMRLDLLLRLVPLTLVPLVFSWLSRTPLRGLGLVITHPLRDLLVAIPAGVAGFAIAAGFNVYLSRRSGRWFVPTKPDLLAQSGYYLVLNAPSKSGSSGGSCRAAWLAGGMRPCSGCSWPPRSSAPTTSSTVGVGARWPGQPRQGLRWA